MWKYLGDVLAKEKINLSLDRVVVERLLKMVKLESCSSEIQQSRQPGLIWVTEKLMMSKESFGCHSHR